MPIQDLLNPNEYVSDQVKAKRLETCATCYHKRKKFGVDICGICKCVLTAKTSLKGEECPILKWSKEAPTR
jgi:hypothetical protein